MVEVCVKFNNITPSPPLFSLNRLRQTKSTTNSISQKESRHNKMQLTCTCAMYTNIMISEEFMFYAHSWRV